MAAKPLSVSHKLRLCNSNHCLLSIKQNFAKTYTSSVYLPCSGPREESRRTVRICHWSRRLTALDTLRPLHFAPSDSCNCSPYEATYLLPPAFYDRMLSSETRSQFFFRQRLFSNRVSYTPSNLTGLFDFQSQALNSHHPWTLDIFAITTRRASSISWGPLLILLCSFCALNAASQAFQFLPVEKLFLQSSIFTIHSAVFSLESLSFSFLEAPSLSSSTD